MLLKSCVQFQHHEGEVRDLSSGLDDDVLFWILFDPDVNAPAINSISPHMRSTLSSGPTFSGLPVSYAENNRAHHSDACTASSISTPWILTGVASCFISPPAV